MKRVALWALGLLSAGLGAHAGELSLQYLPSAYIEYEGTGHRDAPSGWELKVKPWTDVGGLRWRQELGPRWAFQAQGWMNRVIYQTEIGNRNNAFEQEGQTSVDLKTLWIDLRRPLAGSTLEAVFGAHGVRQVFKRKDIVFNSPPDPVEYKETQEALGAHVGFHLAKQGRPGKRGWRLFGDGELLLGHFFWTHNRLESEKGSISSGGYTYAFRAEGGVAGPRWRFSAGYARQMYEILVPGGQSTPSGATVSFPINKTDLFGPFLALGWTY